MQSANIFELALRLSTQTHNISVLESICRANLLTPSSDVNYLVRSISDHLPRLGEVGSNFMDWINIFLFNVCAVNQELMVEYDTQLLESTQSVPKSYSKSKEVVEYNQVIAVRTKLNKWLEAILSLPLFESFFSEITVDIVTRDKSLKHFLETIEYLMTKYTLACKFKQKIIEILEQTSQSSHFSQMLPLYSALNKKLFCSGQKFGALMQEISENYQIELQDIAKLVSINFIEVNPPRVIFNSAENTGMGFVEECVDYMIRKVGKAELFAQKMENFRPYELFIGIVLQKWAAAVIEWNAMVLQLTDLKEKDFYLHKKEAVLQKLISFLTVYIPNDYPCLHYTLKYIYSSLLAKYSTTDSIQLFKKFLLNRFLLNPSFFALLFAPNQQQMKTYVNCANSLRILFYDKKVAALQQGNPQILELSQKMINGMKSMLSGKESKKSGLQVRDRGVYVNDKIVSKIVVELNEALQGCKLQSNHKSNLSDRSDSSLSFSLKNDSRSRAGLGLQSPQKFNNSFIPQLPKPTVRTNPTPRKNTGSNLSQIQQRSQFNSNELRNTQSLPRETVPNTDMGKLEELVFLRREYGELRRDIDARCGERRGRRENRERQLWKMQETASQLRKQLSEGINRLMINTFIF